MAYFPEEFDPSQESGSGGFEPLPPGAYTATVVKADIETPKSGNGHMLSLQWKVIDGEYENRLIFQRCVISHSNETAQRIGRGQIKDICDALGMKAAVRDSDEFLHQTAILKLGIEHDKSGLYEDKNKVVRVLPLAQPGQGNGAPRPTPPIAPNVMNPAPAPKAAAGAGAPPWAR
jgi:hypothetical protein